MIDVTDYVPILSGKAAEYEGLKDLTNVVRRRTRPLIEVMPQTIDHQTEQPSKSLDDQLRKDARYMRECWSEQQLSLLEPPGIPSPIMIDTRNIEHARAEDGTHPVTFLHRLLDDAGLRAIPVTAFDRDADHQEAVAAVCRAHGLCLRLDRNQWADPSQLAADAYALLAEFEIEPGDVDVVIDLGAIGAEDARAAVLLARGALLALPSVHGWRSVVVAGSSFPASVGETVEKHGTCVVPRAEREMYELLVANIEQLPRLPTFGDYGIEGAAGVAGGVAPVFSSQNMSASIRYTGLDGSFLVRGGRLADEGLDQYHKLASTIVDSRHWQSESYSWGDGYIAKCARFEVKPGTAKLWRQVGVNHHITVVMDEISTLLSS